jgi:ABC-type phosphate transport system substrate-binding protein
MRGLLALLVIFGLQLSTSSSVVLANDPCGTNGININGKGAAFPTELMLVWGTAYCQTTPSVRVAYESYNSNGAARGLFDATPAHMYAGVGEPAKDLGYFTGEPRKLAQINQVPVALTAVAYVYNVRDSSGSLITPLNIRINELRQAFGTTTVPNWNDNLTVLSNPTMAARLPAIPMNVACRPDREDIDIQALHNAFMLATNSTITSPQLGAGCTTSKTRLATDQDVKTWLAAGNGRIGIVDYRFALQQSLPMLAICRGTPQNRATYRCVSPNESTIQVAANTEIFNPLPVWPENRDWYPAVGYTWIIFRKDLTSNTDKANIAALTRFLFWALGTQESLSRQQNYIPLPSNTKLFALGQLCIVQIDGARVITAGCPN